MTAASSPVSSREGAPADAEGARLLWLRVVLQAIEDACDKRGGRCEAAGLRDQHAATARAWLSVDCQDFRHVCSLAGLDPVAVEAAVRETLDAGTTPQQIRKRLWMRVESKAGHGGVRGRISEAAA